MVDTWSMDENNDYFLKIFSYLSRMNVTVGFELGSLGVPDRDPQVQKNLIGPNILFGSNKNRSKSVQIQVYGKVSIGYISDPQYRFRFGFYRDLNRYPEYLKFKYEILNHTSSKVRKRRTPYIMCMNRSKFTFSYSSHAPRFILCMYFKAVYHTSGV
ncbi:hypothetical protein YC2023_033589 [Brassica napus]